MSLEETIAAVIRNQLRPLLEEFKDVKAKLEVLQRSLPPELVPAQRAAEVLGLSLSTVRRRIKDGSLPVKRVGSKVLVNLSALHGPTESEVQELREGLRVVS